MNVTTMTMTGNLVAAPELRYTPSGVAVANFRIASTERIKRDGAWQDGETVFMTVTAWRDLGEHVAECLGRGDRVMLAGKLRQRSYETQEGDRRTVYEIEAYDVGVSLQRVTVKLAKAVREVHSSEADAHETAESEPPF